jgi:hypothetical protein
MWAMPSADTFDIPPIREFVKKYLRQSRLSIDPFARNKRWATYTNDLNPDTAAEYHLPALDFLKELRERGVVADLILFDPPYSRRQVMEVYAGIGRDHTNEDSQYFSLNWKDERAVMNDLLGTGGIVLSFGWHSNGMQQSGCYEPVEMVMVAHGGAHNDTICMAERKIAHQTELMLDMKVAA